MQRHTKASQDSKPERERKATLLIGGARNVHGTRISKRVKCHRCGQLDYIGARPKGQSACCRACAKEVMNAYDVGVRVPMPLLEKRCFVCQSLFDLPIIAVVKDRKPLCPNCLRGFEVWRGSLEMNPDSRAQMVCEARRSGTLLRKRLKKKGIPG